MRRDTLWIGVLAIAITACQHAKVETAATPSADKTAGVVSATADAPAIYMVDGVLVTPPSNQDQPAGTSALYVIDGVIVDSPPASENTQTKPMPLYMIDGVIVDTPPGK